MSTNQRDVDTALTEHLDRTQGAIHHADSKASVLVAVVTGALALVAAASTTIHLPTPAVVTGAAGAALLLLAADALLTAVGPRIGKDAATEPDRASFVHWHTCTPQQIREQAADDRRHHAIATLARIAHHKHRLIRRAVTLVRAAGALLAITAILTATL